MQKLAIISSVSEGIFSGLANNKTLGFTQQEIDSALKDEKQVFLDAMGIPDIENKVQIEIIRVMDGIPANYSADAYILGGSPAMVTEREQKEWIDKLIRFVEGEVGKGKPLLGICFGHQILATALGGKVEAMPMRKIGKGTIETGGAVLDSLWSHKQAVTDVGSGTIIGEGKGDTSSQIQMIQYDNATGMQLHPEFSPEFTSFLIKLMREQILAEGLDPEEMLKEISLMNDGNPSRTLIELFIRKYYNI